MIEIMDLIKLIVLSVILVLSQTTSANDTCQDVRLDKTGGCMENVGVRDQIGTNTCYAHAGVELFDAFMSQNKSAKHHQSSAIFAALLYRKHLMNASYSHGKKEEPIPNNEEMGLNLEDLNFGYSCPLLDVLLRKGSCSLDDYPGYNNGRQDTWLHNSLMATYTNFSNDEDEVTMEKQVEKIKGLLTCTKNKLFTDTYIKKIMTEAHSIDVLYDVFDELCDWNNPKSSHRISPPTGNYECKLEEPDAFYRTSETIQGHLNKKNPQPVGINFCQNILTKGTKAKLVTWDTYESKPKAIKGCQHHAAIIIGSRKTSHGCQFLIRNSWGTSCNNYSKRWTCEKGSIWVDDDVVGKNTYGIVSIAPSGT